MQVRFQSYQPVVALASRHNRFAAYFVPLRRGTGNKVNKAVLPASGEALPAKSFLSRKLRNPLLAGVLAFIGGTYALDTSNRYYPVQPEPSVKQSHHFGIRDADVTIRQNPSGWESLFGFLRFKAPERFIVSVNGIETVLAGTQSVDGGKGFARLYLGGFLNSSIEFSMTDKGEVTLRDDHTRQTVHFKNFDVIILDGLAVNGSGPGITHKAYIKDPGTGKMQVIQGEQAVHAALRNLDKARQGEGSQRNLGAEDNTVNLLIPEVGIVANEIRARKMPRAISKVGQPGQSSVLNGGIGIDVATLSFPEMVTWPAPPLVMHEATGKNHITLERPAIEIPATQMAELIFSSGTGDVVIRQKALPGQQPTELALKNFEAIAIPGTGVYFLDPQTQTFGFSPVKDAVQQQETIAGFRAEHPETAADYPFIKE